MTLSTSVSLELVLAWHMHQPDYRDCDSGEFRLPWVYLHAMKDYADMAWHLERHSHMRVVLNLVPVLLDQIEDYAEQIATGRLRDPLLRLLARDDAQPLSAAERAVALEHCFPANRDKMVLPFPPYLRLHDLFTAHGDDGALYLSDHYFYDLVTWYHLSWTGETVRRDFPLIARLMAQGAGFSHADRGELVALIGALLAGLIPRYARLAQERRIELSSTPHFHPLAPLLLDFGSAREARPDLPLPQAPAYPGGAARSSWHLEAALDSHMRRFGRKPAGMWPAEGAVSDALVAQFGGRDIGWTATGEGVLHNSRRAAGLGHSDKTQFLYQPYRIGTAASAPSVFFRDDRLSDLIGFEYAKWHSSEAAASFVAELESIAARTGDATPVVSVILDGENCWEHYPYNGFYFLDALYARLEAHPTIRTATFESIVARASPPPAVLAHVVAGSWVYGDFTTWIGSPEKNRAWELLCEAKRVFDEALPQLDDIQQAAASRQLAVCESSDWFWWLGGYNPAEAVASFDRLYRANLARLYRILHRAPPATLDEPLARGSGAPEGGGAMRRAQ